MINEPRVPVEEWTDEEWLAVMRTVPSNADISVGEQAVAEMRGRCQCSCHQCCVPLDQSCEDCEDEHDE